jgi:hypothetical protein
MVFKGSKLSATSSTCLHGWEGQSVGNKNRAFGRHDGLQELNTKGFHTGNGDGEVK